MSYCCTCALPLNDTKVPYSAETEKPLTFTRTVECCNRTICAACQYDNPRFETYCPFCQISSEPGGPLPSTGLRLPPTYAEAGPSIPPPPEGPGAESPPPYSSIASDSDRSRRSARSSSPPEFTAQDTIHHLSQDETLPSISLLYRVPLPILRAHNSLYSDHLISARKAILIPASHYTGPSLSEPPDPVEEEKKTKVRRWMVQTKSADYDVAGLYLKGSDWDLDLAVEAFKSDDRWEKEHPMKETGSGKGKARKRIGGTGLIGQLG